MKCAATFILVALAAAGCNAGSVPVEVHELGSLEYEMPATWESRPRIEAGRRVVEWSPKDNDGKESITLVESEPLAALAKAGLKAVIPRLVQAQGSLGGTFSSPTIETSSHGFQVARVDGSFTPPNRTQPYRRAHAVFIANDRLIHILYTAERATSNRAALSAVINSFHRKGA